MNANRFPTAQDAVRALTIARARYLENGDDYEYEKWHNASCAYYNITGRDHPLAMYIRTDDEG